MILLQTLFWLSLFLILYTYIIFPAILQILARRKKDPQADNEPRSSDEYPFFSILISAYNEEEVIETKIRSVMDSDYPPDRYEILAGSDHSSDRTNEILLKLEKEHPMISAWIFKERTGKPGVINQLSEKASGEILVITDANVMLDRASLKKLSGSFQNSEIGLVDTRMVNTTLKKDGISHQEKFYIGREVRIKHQESLLWGSMMGPFGGCYAVRKKNYTPVPDHFLVDDFYVNMSVLKQGFKCVSNIKASVYEDVSNDHKEEFRRKKRISAGNFQNLNKFAPLLFSRQPGVAFCFLSHKVIRWIVPLLVMVSLGISLYLGYTAQLQTGHLPLYNNLYMLFALAQILVISIPLIDFILRKIGIHVLPLRFVSHFVLMNLALLAGFFRFLGGIKSNVWQPTKRNQGKVE